MEGGISLEMSLSALIQSQIIIFNKIWTTITPKSSIIPSKRANCGGTIINSGIVIFGGIWKNSIKDLWRFDLGSLIWQEIKGAGAIPKVYFIFLFFN